MIFQHTWQRVLDGSKTQTRRPVQDGDRLRPNELDTEGSWPFPVTVLRRGRLKWEVGHTYAVQPARGKKAVGRICITDIGREGLRDISHEDIEAEGIPSYTCDYEYRVAFLQLWNSAHTKPGTRWRENPEVWVLEFEVVKE